MPRPTDEPLPTPLISALELAEMIDDPRLRVADCRWYLGEPGRGRREYDEGHLPGAIFVDLDVDLVATDGPGRHPLPEPSAFARRMGELGIGSDSLVVAYDSVGGWVASRLWWMLDSLGHAAVSVLDGGFQPWVAAGLPVTAEVVAPPPARLVVPDRWSRVMERDALRGRLGSVVLLDARAAPRYRGEVEPIDPVAGHIPTAVNAPTDDNLGADGRFLPSEALKARFEALRRTAGADGEVVTSCGSGVSATHNALAMRLAGLPDPILYPGSYSDWTRSGEPVAVGPEPGEPSR